MDFTAPEVLQNKRIVVIDDQGSIRGLLQAFLKDAGFRRVDCAMDGRDGLDYLIGHAVDLVICDWNMPKMSGLEILKKVRECEQTSTLPFLMLTSSSELARVRAAVDSGVSEYLIKPFQPKQLFQKVVKLLENSSHQPRRMRPDSSEEPQEMEGFEPAFEDIEGLKGSSGQ